MCIACSLHKVYIPASKPNCAEMMHVLKNSPVVAHVVLVLVVGGGEEEREGTETVVVAVEETAGDSETVEHSESSK